MKLLVRLVYETYLITMLVPRVATMLFVQDVLNACSHINSRSPEEFLQVINLEKTISFAIDATSIWKRIHFSGIVINVSGIAALIACQLQTGKLKTTLNFFC